MGIKPTEATESFEFNLSYFKKGDDLGHFLRQEGMSSIEALLAQAEMLDNDAARCRALAKALKGIPVDIQADTHMISVEGPIKDLKPLTEGDDPLLSQFPWADEDENDMVEKES